MRKTPKLRLHIDRLRLEGLSPTQARAAASFGCRVGPENDGFKREADDIAGKVMAMRDAAPLSLAAKSSKNHGCGDLHKSRQRAPSEWKVTTKKPYAPGGYAQCFIAGRRPTR